MTEAPWQRVLQLLSPLLANVLRVNLDIVRSREHGVLVHTRLKLM